MTVEAPRNEEAVRILLIDDDRDDYYLTKQVLEEIPHFKFELAWEWEYEAGIRRAIRCEHDICLVDYQLGVKSGLDLLRELREAKCKQPVILLTGQMAADIDIQAMNAGAADFLEKSRLEPTLLDRAIRYARQQRRYEGELEDKVAARTEELARANDALRQADRRKDEFLATLAHELRNPLAPIRNALEIMRLAANDATTIERARQMMERQTQQLVRLIDDLLDISRITRDKLNLEFEVLPIGEILESALESTRPLIDKARLKLKVRIPDVPIRVRADRVRLAQIFSNLLNNAAKYTPPGGTVTLAVTRQGAQAVVCVQDTGVGIPPEMRADIFELFTQVDRTLNRSQGGLGIGLALVKKLVEKHGGTIEARSEGIDRGTTMLVTLPVVD